MISKKDLLKEMDISYGQLYRWKREGLIPDEWFNKQSVSTGQETYFKRDLIIPRIQKILELKDIYQLDQLRAFLNPNLERRMFSVRELVMIDELDPLVLKIFTNQKSTLHLHEVILVYIFSLYKDEIHLEDYMQCDFSLVDGLNFTCYVIEVERKYLLFAKDTIIIDHHLKVVNTIKFEDVANIIAKSL